MNSFFFQGFLDLRLEPWIRNMLTRCLAIVPSLIVAVIGGSAGAGKLIIIASVRNLCLQIFSNFVTWEYACVKVNILSNKKKVNILFYIVMLEYHGSFSYNFNLIALLSLLCITALLVSAEMKRD